MKFANLSRQLKKVLLSVILAICMVSCKWEDKHFYVEDLGIFIDVERRDDVIDEYRIFLYKDAEDKGKDYIDLHYYPSDLSSISLCFPDDDADKIYILDDHRHAVRHFETSEFDLNLLRIKGPKNSEAMTSEEFDEMMEMSARIDSVKSIPGTKIIFNSMFEDLTLWREWDDYKHIRKDGKLIKNIDVNSTPPRARD